MIEIKEIRKETLYKVSIKSVGSTQYFTFKEKRELFQFLDMYLKHCDYEFELTVRKEENEE